MNFIEKTNKLFKKYNIVPKEIKICGEIPLEDKNFLICHLLETFELARKNSVKGSYTASSYACGIILDDNSIHFGINFNDTRCEISSICAERMALLEAFKSKVESFSDNDKFVYKIKYILMSSYEKEDIFWEDKITPCADCLSWFNASGNLSFDTKICYLRKENNDLLLEIQPLDKFLPLRNLSYKTYMKDDFKIKKSPACQKIEVNNEKIIELYKKTLSSYLENDLAKTSGQNIAAGVIANGEIFTGVKIDFSKRWFIEPLMAASYKAIEKYKLNSSGSDDALRLTPFKNMSLEQCLEFIADDELLEVTPKSLRMRKKILNAELRAKAAAKLKKG